MAIRKHKGTSWLIDVTVGGKRKTAVYPGGTPKLHLELAEARLKQELLEAAVAAEGEPELPTKAGGGWTLERGFNNSKSTRSAWKTAEQLVTIEKRWNVIKRYISPQLLLTELDTERMDEFVQEVMDDRGITGATVNRYLSFLSAILTDAARRKKITSMPFFPRQEEDGGRIRWLTEDEEALFLATAVRMEYHEVAAATAVFIDTGMRMGELWKTTGRQVDFDLGLLILHPEQTKTSRGRSLPITERMATILKPRCEHPDSPVFPEFSTEGFHRKFVKVAKAAGLAKLIPYVCRHTCCTRLVRRGVPLFAVAEHMGHSSLQTTRRYAHFAPQDKDTLRQVLQGAQWNAAQGMMAQ